MNTSRRIVSFSNRKNSPNDFINPNQAAHINPLFLYVYTIRVKNKFRRYFNSLNFSFNELSVKKKTCEFPLHFYSDAFQSARLFSFSSSAQPLYPNQTHIIFVVFCMHTNAVLNLSEKPCRLF